MQTLTQGALEALPAEVKALVRDGVYALYKLRRMTKSGATYLLLMRGPKSRGYLLSSRGELVADPIPNNIAEEVEAAVTFGDAGEGARINYL